MTGTMGMTTVPLPAFWSSPNEGEQLRRSPRKEHLCQNPRCAASNMACSTPRKESPAKRIKSPFKNAKPDNLAPVSSNGSETESKNSGGIKANGSYAGEYADCHFANNVSPVSSKGTRTELETCGGSKAHGGHAGKFADCKVGNDVCPVSFNRTRTEVENRGGIKAHGSHAGKYADCKVANNLCSVSSKGTGTEMDNCGGIKAHSHAGKDTDCKVVLAPRTTAKIRESSSVNSMKGSTGSISKESTTPISSSSHAPSVPTPMRRPSKPSKMGLAPLSVLEGNSSTSGSSPGGCSQRTSQSLSTCRLSESMDNTIDDQLTPSFLRGGRVAPPNSERDEEEVPSIEELDRHKPPLTLPLCNRLPIGSSSTSRWPPTLPTEVDPIERPVNLAPDNDSTTSNLPPPPLTCILPTMPPEATPKGIRATPMLCCSSPKVSKSCEGDSEFGFRCGTPEATMKGIPATALQCSSSSIASKVSEGHTGSGNPNETPQIKNFRRRRTPAIPKSTERDRSIKSSTLATMGNAAQMCILEQRLEDEDHQSNSSNLTTLGSDSPNESSSMDLSSSLCGSKPVSAFYNALYAPDCTMSGTKALEAHLHRHRRGIDGTLRVALEIAMLSVMVTILVVVFYPAITRGLVSQFHSCCSCPAAPAAAVSQNPSQHYSQIRSNDGSCVYTGEGRLLKCSSAQRTMGSTVVK